MFSGCKKEAEPEPKPVADFSYTPGSTGLMQFTNLSKNATVYQWQFGDGQSSTVSSPSISYSSNGQYDVTLIAKNAAGDQDLISKRVDITTIPTTGNIVVGSAVKNRGQSDVYVDGTYAGTIKNYSLGGSPACGDPNWVTINKPAGTYLIEARCTYPTAGYWSAKMTVVNGQCSPLTLTTNTGDVIFWTNASSLCSYDVFVDNVYQGTGRTHQIGITAPVVYTAGFVTVTRPAGTYSYRVRQNGLCGKQWTGTFTVGVNDWSSVYLPY